MTPDATASSRGAILVDRELELRLGDWIRPAPGASPCRAAQVQPASLDLRLGPIAHRVRAGFLPGDIPIETRLERLSSGTLDLTGEGAVLERGLVYLIKLEEELHLPPGVRGRFNPRSSTGRCDLFTRVLCPGHPRFDEAPEGYSGPIWLEVSPLSFPTRLRREDRLCQLRLSRGEPALTRDELREFYAHTPLAFEGERPIGLDELRFDHEGGLELSVGLLDRKPAGWRAAAHTDVLNFGKEHSNDPTEFWEPVHAPDGRAILTPSSFYLFASRERLRIPPTLAAEMLPVDIGIGELRNNYAGFFDSGFGWREDEQGAEIPGGTPAVLEVRAHDVPFLVEDGQVFFRIRFFRAQERPQALYGVQRQGASYAGQDLTAARCFRPFSS